MIFGNSLMCKIRQLKTGRSYEIESIDNANVITISVNPKEYFEKYRDKTVNKKHKGLKKDTPGMNFEAYSQCICSLHEFCTNQKPKKLNKNI